MRLKGKLVRWNGDKGFGFIRCEENHEEYFVHISAFPRDGVPPRIDESVSFEVGKGRDGRPRAESVHRGNGPAPVKVHQPHRAPSTPKSPRRPNPRSTRPRFTSLLMSVALLAGGYWAAKPLLSGQDTQPTAQMSQVNSSAVDEQQDDNLDVAASQFSCDGRTYCSEMGSYEEAKFFRDNCPNTKLDGNHDGEPCEAQFGH